MAAERISGIEQRILNVETMMTALGDKLSNVQGTTVGLGDQMTKVQEQTVQLGVDLTRYANSLATEKVSFTNELNAEFDGHKRALAQVVIDARDEFNGLKTSLADLYGKTAQAFVDVKTKVEKLEADILQRGSDSKGTHSTSKMGFIPIKSMVPAVFGKHEDEWRGWQEDVADYLEAQRPGMKALLKAAEKETGPIDDLWMRQRRTEYLVDVEGERANVYRALKALTVGEAKVVVQGVRSEDGYVAWRALHQRFGPSIAARQGKVMCDLSAMVAKPAKSPADTRTLVTELERRIRIAEDVTGEALGDGHIKSVLASILDPLTRAHTSAYQGAGTSYQELKRAVLEFANNTAANRAEAGDPMNIGQCGACTEEQPAAAAAEETWEIVADQQLAAVSAHTQCYQCGGYGHLANTCSTPKGKGKGGKSSAEAGFGPKGGPKGGKGESGKGGKGPKGSAKGGKRGPAGGCWTCGGQHFASECPGVSAVYGGKGGKGGKGVNAIEQWQGWWPEASVRPLCTLRVATPTRRAVKIANRFEALQEEEMMEIEEDKPHAPISADFVQTALKRQPQKQQPQPQLQQQTLRQLSPLATIEPEGLNPVNATPQWEVIEMAVDSGASETVIPEEMIQAAKLQPSEASKRGVQYEVANGQRIPNLGQKAFQGMSDEGVLRGVTAQVCDVNKPLLSVSRLVKAGNTVVFGADGAYVEDNATQERMWLHESGGMYMLKLWVPTEGF